MLESRRETPSDEAWLNISKNLEKKTVQKYKRKYWMIAVAASFIGVLVTLGIFNLNIKTENPTVVTSPENSIKEIQDSKVIERPVLQIANVLKPNKKIKNEVQLPNSKFEIINFKQIEKVQKSKINSTKAESLLAEVEQELVENEAEEKLLSEVEALLAEAQSDLDSDTKRKIIDRVDPASLLAEIDPNSKMDFKDLIIQKIEDNYKELRSSFTAR